MPNHPPPQGHPPGVIVDEVGQKIAKELRDNPLMAIRPGASGPVLSELTDNELRENAEDDPCMPIRNLAGHLVTCNYGDWADFTKCKCAEGLLSAPEQKTAFVIAPMPLRDLLASSVNVSDEMAHELAMGIRQARKQNNKIESVGEALGVSNEPPITVVELADARAKIRYLEADAMIVWRGESLRINADAARAAKVEAAGAKAEATAICVCGHHAAQHKAIGDDACMLTDCGCKRYDRQADAPRIVMP